MDNPKIVDNFWQIWVESVKTSVTLWITWCVVEWGECIEARSWAEVFSTDAATQSYFLQNLPFGRMNTPLITPQMG